MLKQSTSYLLLTLAKICLPKSTKRDWVNNDAENSFLSIRVRAAIIIIIIYQPNTNTINFYYIRKCISFDFFYRELGGTAIIQCIAMATGASTAHWRLVFPKGVVVNGLWRWAHLQVRKPNIAWCDPKISSKEREWMSREYINFYFSSTYLPTTRFCKLPIISF